MTPSHLAKSSRSYRLWVSDDRMVLVRFWESGIVEVCTRDHPDGIWGPPRRLKEERS